jgi:hypothetical protein
VLGLHSIKLCLQDNILDGVVAGWGQVGDGAPRLGRQHNVMLDEVVFLHNAVHVAARDVGPDAQLPRLELPLLCHTENRQKAVQIQQSMQGLYLTLPTACSDILLCKNIFTSLSLISPYF